MGSCMPLNSHKSTTLCTEDSFTEFHWFWNSFTDKWLCLSITCQKSHSFKKLCMHWSTIVSDDSILLCWSNLQSVGQFANCCSREIANPIALLPLRKFLQHPDELDRPCSSVKPVLQLVEPVGRTYAANVGESVLSDQGVEGVPNNLPMADWSFPQRGHSAPHLRASWLEREL